jgi:hypothetical protein
MSRLTKQHALKIAHKLGAVIDTGKAHDLAKIYHEKKKVAQFGIRRGSKKDLPHDYISEQLHVTKSQCLDLASCPLNRGEWIRLLVEKRIIEKEKLASPREGQGTPSHRKKK